MSLVVVGDPLNTNVELAEGNESNWENVPEVVDWIWEGQKALSTNAASICVAFDLLRATRSM